MPGAVSPVPREACIPKESPLGPLNSRPLTVPSMVYHLCVVIGLEEAID